MKNKITFEEFLQITEKLEITYGSVISAEPVKKSKLFKLTVDFGDTHGVKTVATNISDLVSDPEFLVGKNYPFITNLEPREQKGILSEAMIVLPKFGGQGRVPVTDPSIPNGSQLI